MRMFPTALCRHREFRKVHYVPVDQRLFQAVRIEFLTVVCLHVPYEDIATPIKVVLHFRNNYQWRSTAAVAI